MTETQGADLTAYVDGDAVVICDPTNPKAWIRSDSVVAATDGPDDVTQPVSQP